MPRIEVKANEATVSKTRQNELITRLSNAVLKAENADPQNPAAQALVWAEYSASDNGASYVGGANVDKPPVVISITTPQGALNAERRAQLVAEVGSIVDDIVGTFDNRLNHWALLYEVAEGSWGGAGQIFPLVGIQSAMNIPAEQPTN